MMTKPGMRPMYRPDMRPPMGAQRPVRKVPLTLFKTSPATLSLLQGFAGRGREIVFPPGSVEATPPLMMKRKKLNKLDVQPVEGWRLVMCLRSGLLMESTWALDVLNILLYDDNAFPYFGLGNMPGLLEALLEHWRATLIDMFGITADMEGEDEGSRMAVRDRRMGEYKKRKWWETRRVRAEEESAEELDLGRVRHPPDPADKITVLSTSRDLTKRARFAEENDDTLSFQLEECDDALFVTDDYRDWDRVAGGAAATDEDAVGCLGVELSSDHWRMGGGNTTTHIVPSFAADLGVVPFVRLLKQIGSDQKDDHLVEEVKVEVKAEEDGEDATDDHEESKEEKEVQEDIVDRIRRLTGIILRDPEEARRRWRQESLEDECYLRDEPSLHLTTETQDSLGKRAVCVSTILRNLTFLPGNEVEFGRSATFLTIAGRLLLLQHWYPPRNPSRQRNYDRGGGEDEGESNSKENPTSSSVEDPEWWWEHLHTLRENVLVCLANISGALELRALDESVARPLLEGLLEWAVSASSYAQDPFPHVGMHSPVSPQRLAVEALTKLCLHEANVDLLLSTPPYSRIERLTRVLARRLYRYEDQVLREFSINLLFYLAGADSGVARAVAVADQTVGLLLGFIEQAEQNAMVVAQQHGVNALRDNPDSMGTSLDMLRRAASTLHHLSKHPDNIALLVKHEQRLLALVMSQILDQGVAAILSNVLFHIGQEQEQEKRRLEEQREKEATKEEEKEDKEGEAEQKAEENIAETSAAVASS